MNSWPRSIRARLTLWYTAALAAIVILVSISVFALVRQHIMQQLEGRLDLDTGMIAAIMHGPPEGELEEGEEEDVWRTEEMQELTEQDVIPFFRVVRNDSLFFVSDGWLDADLDAALPGSVEGASWNWDIGEDQFYLLRTTLLQEDAVHFAVTVAVEATVLNLLRTLALLLLFVFPVSLILATLGGYLIAGRVLAPIGAMATKSELITSHRLSERLPVENPDDELGRLATVFNTMLARIERSFDQLRRFTSEASHALRTPLTAIRSVGEVGLQEGNGVKFYRDVIGSMLEETDRLRALVEKLLVLTRAEGGQIQAARETFHLSVLAEETVDRLRVLAEEKQQEFETAVNSDPAVSADREMVRQALINLLDNAIRNTAPGGSIRLVVDRLPGGEGCLEVRDTGRGIPEEHLDHIFERLCRVEGVSEEGPRGSGLGLAIARRYLELNDGRIEVESEVGKGSVFRIVLPP